MLVADKNLWKTELHIRVVSDTPKRTREPSSTGDWVKRQASDQGQGKVVLAKVLLAPHTWAFTGSWPVEGVWGTKIQDPLCSPQRCITFERDVL